MMRRRLRKLRPVLAIVVVLIVIGAAAYYVIEGLSPPLQFNHTLVLPADCQAPACRVGFNVTSTRPELLSMRYAAQAPAYAELDVLSHGAWNQVTNSSAAGGSSVPSSSGSIVATVCISATYRYWFDEGQDNSQNVVTATVNVVLVNATYAGCYGNE